MKASRQNYFIQQSQLPASSEYVWELMTQSDFHSRLAPPWINWKISEGITEVKEGQVASFEIRNGPLKGKWLTEIVSVRKGYLIGYRLTPPNGDSWSLWSRCLPGETANDCVLEDRFEYPKRNRMVASKKSLDTLLKNITYYKHRTLKNDLHFHRQQPPEKGSSRVILAGGSGLVGTHLTPYLRLLGYEVRNLTTNPETSGLQWDPKIGKIPVADLEDLHAIVNLSGFPIACRWTQKNKAAILNSRVQATKLLADTISELKSPPKHFIQISATGYYGFRSKESIDESNHEGEGFLAEVCKQWEEAAQLKEHITTQLKILRLGVVLSPKGGALKKMLPAFRLGLGGRLGGGKQPFPWISLDDVIRMIGFAIETETPDRVFNACSPVETNNMDFTKELSSVLKKPAIFPVPSLVLKTIFGTMAEEALLGGVNVFPEQTLETGFQFFDTSISEALRYSMGKW
ncbi:MAG: TIGR01777 family oxidoreductase [Opitutales bacterium]|nr:TIGR01777 family oxidoreductase [Opitutales bacterium]